MPGEIEPVEGPELPKISTGNIGLDDILAGGVDPERVYLFEGQPGSGKTTLALEFLLEGGRRGERTLYITLSEKSSLGARGPTTSGRRLNRRSSYYRSCDAGYDRERTRL